MAHRRAAALALLAAGASAVPSEVEKAFEEFVAKYGRRYDSPEEQAQRLKNFEDSWNYVNAQNAKGSSFHLVINEFADQAPHEFHSTHFGMSIPEGGHRSGSMPLLGVDLYSGAPLPESVDWVKKGAVTPVKNQGHCGSCWSFSTTGALEGAWFIATGELVSLSEQQLIDCSNANNGCQGGAMDSAFAYLQDHNSYTEDSYPYVHAAGVCIHNSSFVTGIPKGSVIGSFDVPADDEKALMEAIAQQPVSVAIEADLHAFQLYGGGVIKKECGTKLDHGVLLVGYGTDNGVDYWKVKNSWGPTWGEGGYVRIERGKTDGGNAGECGIRSMASYPRVKASGPAPTPAPAPPAPTPAPAPAPTPPQPGCSDKESFCKDPSIFDQKSLCPIIGMDDCMQTCGCCDDSPKSYCKDIPSPGAQQKAKAMMESKLKEIVV